MTLKDIFLIFNNYFKIKNTFITIDNRYFIYTFDVLIQIAF